jgi:hypothetical protein
MKDENITYNSIDGMWLVEGDCTKYSFSEPGECGDVGDADD